MCYLDNIEITQAVALRKESVDRNLLGVGCLVMLGVALRKESVDRNKGLWNIQSSAVIVKLSIVALRKESVDRNFVAQNQRHKKSPSLSARRAWIEIGNPRKKP